MNHALFDELGKTRPDCARIHALLRSGADINALVKMRDSHLTAYWHMRGGIGKHKYWQNILHSLWGTVDLDAKLAAFKAHYYPLLDILETYDFNIMNGSSFRLADDGTQRGHMFAGFRFLDHHEFVILAKYDMPRLVHFFERLYFSKGHSVDDTTRIGSISYLSPLLWSVPESYKPAVILYFLMKGARWNNPAWRQPGYEARITNFAEQVPANVAAAMIVKLQQQLGVNFITGPQGANLRGFLAAAYGTVVAVHILEKALGIIAIERRRAALLHAPIVHFSV
jgi:hypothetical protein